MKITIATVAKTCHEVNRAYCAGHGDDSQPSWEEAPQWQRDSAINGVKFHLKNPNAGPQASHESWYAEKASQGWVYGEVKDVEKKTHPCMVPYSELPIQQQTKDSLFINVVKSFVE